MGSGEVLAGRHPLWDEATKQSCFACTESNAVSRTGVMVCLLRTGQTTCGEQHAILGNSEGQRPTAVHL